MRKGSTTLLPESAAMRVARRLGFEGVAWALRRLHCPAAKDALVLEVGSGGSPYARANVLLDAYEATRERHWVPLVADRPTVLGFVENLPFRDGAFDFVIASHVLEHSSDPRLFGSIQADHQVPFRSQTPLETRLADDSLGRALQAAAETLQKEYDSGILTPLQAQQRQAELQKQQEYIQKFEQDAQQLVSAKREELLKPILLKVDEAIKAVATENGYAMIFDTSTGAMLFANDTDDVTALVKKKLGL